MLARHTLLRIPIVTLLAFVAGGCPLGPTTEDAGAASYWVAVRGEQLSYYEMPKTREAPGRWIAVEEGEVDWFSGPAFYRLSADGRWLRDEGAIAFALDDALIVHDPAPGL